MLKPVPANAERTTLRSGGNSPSWQIFPFADPFLTFALFLRLVAFPTSLGVFVLLLPLTSLGVTGDGGKDGYILPHILEGFQLTGQAAITTAGTIMMAYMATAIAGNYLLVNLSSRLGQTRTIAIACLLAAALQCLLYFSSGVYSFTLIRVLQTGMIAAVIPLVISTFADHS